MVARDADRGVAPSRGRRITAIALTTCERLLLTPIPPVLVRPDSVTSLAEKPASRWTGIIWK